MRKRTLIAAVSIAVLALAGGGYALAGGSGGMIWDGDHYAQPGSLDDGRDLLPQTTISLTDAVAAAQRAESGALGQVDLEQTNGRLVYMVDIGDKEVRVDAADGSIASVSPRS